MTRARTYGLILLLAFAALYLLTLDDGLRPGELEGGDLITHQYAQVLGRPGNAPGYPLYTLGGWLWFRAGRLLAGPGANPIPILSSYSTLWALVALALLYVLMLESGVTPLWALLASAFYGVTYFFWYYAVTTEQYTSAVAWTLSVVLLAFRWQRTHRDAYLLGLALLVGIALAHMVTLLLIIPPLAWFVLSQEPNLRRRPKLLIGMAALVALPLASYLFVYASGAAHPEWRGAGEWGSTTAWFLNFVSTRQGREELAWTPRPLFTAEFPALIWREMTWLGLAAGLAGWALMERRRSWFLFATLVLYLLFAWVDRLGNWYQVVMPVYALLALGLGVAAQAAWQALWGGEARGRLPREVALIVPAVLLALIVYRGALSLPHADSSDRPGDTALDPGWAILADRPPDGAVVFATTGEARALDYLGTIWGARPDARAAGAAEAAERFRQGRPLLATQGALPLVPAEISPDARYSALGPVLVHISREAAGTPGSPGLLPWGHDFGGILQLRGVRVEPYARGRLAVLLEWQALVPPQEDWSVSVRLLRNDQQIAQQDHAHPVAGAYPTSRWTAGETVVDAYTFAVPDDRHPDGIRVVVYRPDGAGGFVELGAADLPLPAP